MSIALFGATSPKKFTPQSTVIEPMTVYGISKMAGERWCEYYFKKFGVDVRSLRYPGIISYKSKPGGGTTDYAVDIFHAALKSHSYTCYLDRNMKLPMMFMDDAIRATVEIMNIERSNLKINSSYNISAMSFSPHEIASEIRKYIDNFKIYYKPDFRNKIADSWPDSINDDFARKDWNWSHNFDLEKTVSVMITEVQKKLRTKVNLK